MLRLNCAGVDAKVGVERSPAWIIKAVSPDHQGALQSRIFLLQLQPQITA